MSTPAQQRSNKRTRPDGASLSSSSPAVSARKKPRKCRGLAVGDPVRVVVELAFDWMHASRLVDTAMPTDLSDIMLEYLAPSALHTLAADPDAVLMTADLMPTQPFENAIWEIFHTFASQTNPDVPFPHKTMNFADLNVWINTCLRDDQVTLMSFDVDERNQEHLNNHGMPAYGNRTEMNFRGFMELYYHAARKSGGERIVRNDLIAMASFLCGAAGAAADAHSA